MKNRKWDLWRARDGLCDYCGKWMQPIDMACHIHHALVYKSDLPRSKQQGIDAPINLMLVHANPCHAALQSDRQWTWEFKVAQYSDEAVRAYVHRMRPKTAKYALPLSVDPSVSVELTVEEELAVRR